MSQPLLERLIFVLLCLILIWAPLPLGSNRPWAWSLLQLLIGSAFLLHLWRLALLPSQEFWPRCWPRWLNPLILPLALMQLYLGLQYTGVVPGISSIDPKQTQIMLIKGVFFLCWVLLIASYCQTPQRQKTLVLTMVVAGVFQAFYGSVLNLAGIEISPWFQVEESGRARGTFVYQNHFANYLALSIAIALGLLLTQLSSQASSWRWRQSSRDFLSALLSLKFFLRLALVVMVIGLVLSRSRMGNAAFFTSLSLVGMLALFVYKRPPAMLKPLLISILVLDVLIIGSMFGLEKLQQRFEETSFAAEARDEVVRDGLLILKDYGWQGSGGGSFYTVFPAYQPNFYSGFYDHAHNDYLQFAIELGIPITAMLGLMLLKSLWQNLQVMRLHPDKRARGLAFGCAMATVHMLIHCSVDFNLQAPANALLFLTLLTLGQILCMELSNNNINSKVAKKAADH